MHAVVLGSLLPIIFLFVMFFIFFKYYSSSNSQLLPNRIVSFFTARLRRPSRTSIYIPDEILLKIFSKLPAESVLICRCVCRRWKALTSTHDFLRLYSSFSIPTAICLNWEDGKEAKISVVESRGGAAKKAEKTLKTHKVSVNSMSPVSKSPYPLKFLYSIHGLLIFSQKVPSNANLKHTVIVNPLTKEKVRLVTPDGRISGAFLNPLAKDQHCLLWAGGALRPDGSARNIIIVLGGVTRGSNSQTQTQTCCYWRELYDDGGASVSYRPKYVLPVMVDDVLYWMVGSRIATSRHGTSPPRTRLHHTCAESIMAFNTKTEKFSVMPHPGPHKNWCQEDPEHKRMNLAEINEDHGRSRVLCLYECSLLEPVINMWILEQRQEQDGNDNNSTPASWIRWHRLDIHMLFDIRNPYNHSAATVWRPLVAIVKGEAYLSFRRELFAINLNDVRVQRISKKKKNRWWMPFSPSLVFLRNCECEIWIP